MAGNWGSYWKNRESAAVKETAAFNQAIAYLYRLDEVIRLCNHFSAEYDLDNWYLSLCVFYRELLPRMDRQEFEAITPLIKEGRLFHINKSSGANIDVNSYFDVLDKLDQRLRITMNAHGLLMPSKEDAISATFIDEVKREPNSDGTITLDNIMPQHPNSTQKGGSQKRKKPKDYDFVLPEKEIIDAEPI
jgi:hypothetical protein